MLRQGLEIRPRPQPPGGAEPSDAGVPQRAIPRARAVLPQPPVPPRPEGPARPLVRKRQPAKSVARPAGRAQARRLQARGGANLGGRVERA